MKIIKKLKLINWHFFDNQEFEFSSINVITGENGTGKSTILDAIHYLQSGGTCKFNTAANTLAKSNTASGRTVENYLKARIGGEKLEFVRDKPDIIGHIAIEYYNEATRKPFVLGCVLQLASGSLNKPIFYKIDGDTYCDALFFSKDGDVNGYDEMEKAARIMGLPLIMVGQKAQSMQARKRAVLDALGISEKYETLFAKAIGFEPLGDISPFVMDFLLDAGDPLDLTAIKESMDAYRDIQYQVALENKRLQELQPIMDNKDRYEEALQREAALAVLGFEADIQMRDASIRKNESLIIVANDEQRANAEASKQAEAEADGLQRDANEIKSSDEMKVMQRLYKEREDVKEHFDVVKSAVDEWVANIRFESNLARRLGTSLDLTGIINRKDFASYIATLSDYKQRLRQISDENDEIRGTLALEYRVLLVRKATLEGKIKTLSENRRAFPDEVTRLSEEIIKAVIAKQGNASDLNLQCLSSLIEINDPEWTDAIEGLLNKRRFDFFISQRYFATASTCFANSPKSLTDFFEAGVIAPQLTDNTPLPGSLAEKIDAFRIDQNGERQELSGPRSYIDFLLGDIICVGSVADFKRGQKAITKSGVFFDGESIRYVSKQAMETPFIGQEAIARQLEKAISDLEEVKRQISEIEAKKEEAQKLFNALKTSILEKLLSESNHWSDLASVTEQLNEINEKIKGLEAINGDLAKLYEQISELERRAKEKRQLSVTLSEKATKASQRVGALLNDNERFVREIGDAKKKLDASRKVFFDLGGSEESLMTLAEGRTGQALKDYVWNQSGPVANMKNAAEGAIRLAISNYQSNHPGELPNDISGYLQYVQRYNKIQNDDLAKLNPDLEEAYRRSMQELEEHFISSIRDSLGQARQSIDLLNRALKKNPFGTEEEVFEFLAEKTKDTLLGGVYRIAMETNQDSVVNNLLTEGLDMEGEEIMKKVFDILSRPEDDTETKALRQEITDYRQYFNYDIRIHVKDGNDRRYSENFDAKSGGETQTPFYALIAGAFQSLLTGAERNGRSPIGLVLFDEAFNNMDGSRIQQMLKFYRDLRIQLIISVPSSRLSYILPYADSVTSLAKVGYSIGVYKNPRDEQ